MAKVIIIGGGAAGLMAAGAAVRLGHEVTVLEHSELPGKKILVTGKGRCNVTNACDEETFLQNVRTNPRFLYSALYAFPPSATMELFEYQLGVPLKTERGRRVFPVSDKAEDIRQALLTYANAARIVEADADSLLMEDGRCVGVQDTRHRKWLGDCVLVATGGLSYPGTGSTGDGYRLAKQAGHKIVPAVPSLCSLVSPDPACAKMMGLALKNVILTLYQDTKPVYSEQGEMLFTHFGISGPLTLSASCYIKNIQQHQWRAEIDLKPALDEETLYKRITNDFALLANKSAQGALVKLLPASMQPVMVERWGIDPATKANQITREQKRELVRLIKHWSVPITKRGDLEHAIITSGGVDVREVNPKTMESKLCSGLYFAGEVLDVDAYTGGYNLQIAFCTAQAAARAFKDIEKEKVNIMSVINIAIDGPSGAGKSSLAKQLAKDLGFLYVDTGAMYRSIGLHTLRSGADPKDAPAVEALLPQIHLDIKLIDGTQHIFLNGEDVSTDIRTEACGMAASAVSAIPAVRQFLLDTQRDLAKANNVLMDGRDIGTVILPNAQVKIYLTASAEARAARRYKELVEKGQPADYEKVLADIQQRDYQDTHREIAPLRQAEDAVLVDTSELNIEESLEALKAVIRQKVG